MVNLPIIEKVISAIYVPNNWADPAATPIEEIKKEIQRRKRKKKEG